MAEVENNRVILEERIVSRVGEVLNPKEININSQKVDLENNIDENGNISIDTSNYKSGYYGVYITYENLEDNHEVGVFYMFQVK
ncbi:MAG: hypothetical protein KIC47_05045 [Clostridium sp.]|nr:hypothetical protein [Clostridium sp.]